jgi:hypothetical protein
LLAELVITQPPLWCSTDLRDGNQALIEPMDQPRKLRMFETQIRIGFKQIDIGFPAASQIEFDFVRRFDRRGPDPHRRDRSGADAGPPGAGRASVPFTRRADLPHDIGSGIGRPEPGPAPYQHCQSGHGL